MLDLMSAGEQKRKEETKKKGGRRPGDWQKIYILIVSNVTTFRFFLTGNSTAIFTKGKKKKGAYFEEKNIV